MIVDLEPNDPRWASAFPVLQELRPTLTTEQFQQVLAEGTGQGLRFTAVFEDDQCVAIAGWRVIANMSAIRKLYVDDLSTAASARSRGHGATLLNELMERGRQLGCTLIDLDSGVQRFDAHRFYLTQRMHINSHHFTKDLS